MIDKKRYQEELYNIKDNNTKEYIKQIFKNDIQITFKIVCNWMSSEEVTKIWNKFSQDGQGKWNNIQSTTGDDYDYLVIINAPPPGIKYEKKNTIIVEMEPFWEQKHPVKEEMYFGALIHRLTHNMCEWNISQTYSEIPSLTFEKEDKISAILSQKYADIGQMKRIDFAKYLEKNGVDIDVYGNGGKRWKWKNDKGPLPYHQKDEGLFKYKYHFQAENNQIKNYISEKLYDGILSECLVFYFGAPNVKEIIDERCYVVLDLVDFEKDMNTIKKAMKEDLWSQRLPYIRAAKEKILNELNVFPRIEKTINQ